MISTIVVGYDGAEPASQALDRAIEKTRSARAQLLVVAVEEMPLNPEGPQNFGTLDDTPARIVPLVEPADLERVLAEAKERIDAAGLTGEYVWAAGEPASANRRRRAGAGGGTDRHRLAPPRPASTGSRPGRRHPGQA